MFSVRQKREIADKIQKILRETNHPELPAGEIAFHLHVDGAASWSWADITDNARAVAPGVNQWNEMQDRSATYLTCRQAVVSGLVANGPLDRRVRGRRLVWE